MFLPKLGTLELRVVNLALIFDLFFFFSFIHLWDVVLWFI